jgi:hypothetical protein
VDKQTNEKVGRREKEICRPRNYYFHFISSSRFLQTSKLIKKLLEAVDLRSCVFIIIGEQIEYRKYFNCSQWYRLVI